MLLAQITSSTIEEISFPLGYVHWNKILDIFPLERVEEILTGEIFCNLRAVVFGLCEDEPRSSADYRRIITRRMELLDARGLLRFDILDND
jgi:hypothetical protein